MIKDKLQKDLRSQQEVIISFAALPEHSNYTSLLNLLNTIYFQLIKKIIKS